MVSYPGKKINIPKWVMNQVCDALWINQATHRSISTSNYLIIRWMCRYPIEIIAYKGFAAKFFVASIDTHPKVCIMHQVGPKLKPFSVEYSYDLVSSHKPIWMMSSDEPTMYEIIYSYRNFKEKSYSVVNIMPANDMAPYVLGQTQLWSRLVHGYIWHLKK